MICSKCNREMDDGEARRFKLVTDMMDRLIVRFGGVAKNRDPACVECARRIVDALADRYVEKGEE